MISKKEKREDAVSPVIGVMLMLVITIVIAGVVSVIAGGLSEGVDETPNAVIKLDDYTLYYQPPSSGFENGYDLTDVVFKHISGDILHLDDLNMVLVGDESGLIAQYTDLTLFDINSGKLWSPGETLHIYVDGGDLATAGDASVFKQSFSLPFKMTFHLVTKSGEIVAEETVTII